MEIIENVIGTLAELITRIDLYTGEEVTRTKEQWISFFARFGEWNNALFQLNVAGNDMYAYFKNPWVPEKPEYYTRRYLYISILDERTIDIRCWADEVFRKMKEDYRWHRKRSGPDDPNFRCGPVPGIRKGHGYAGLRYMRTTNERRQNADPEALPFVRGSRRPNVLVNAYDDIFRSETRSWKDNKKVRHQWEARRKAGEYHCTEWMTDEDESFAEECEED